MLALANTTIIPAMPAFFTDSFCIAPASSLFVEQTISPTWSDMVDYQAKLDPLCNFISGARSDDELNKRISIIQENIRREQEQGYFADKCIRFCVSRISDGVKRIRSDFCAFAQASDREYLKHEALQYASVCHSNDALFVQSSRQQSALKKVEDEFDYDENPSTPSLLFNRLWDTTCLLIDRCRAIGHCLVPPKMRPKKLS